MSSQNGEATGPQGLRLGLSNLFSSIFLPILCFILAIDPILS